MACCRSFARLCCFVHMLHSKNANVKIAYYMTFIFLVLFGMMPMHYMSLSSKEKGGLRKYIGSRYIARHWQPLMTRVPFRAYPPFMAMSHVSF